MKVLAKHKALHADEAEQLARNLQMDEAYATAQQA